MISTASHCAHGNQMHDCSVCRTSEEIRELRAKLKAAVGIAQKFAEAARDACIAGLAQSAKLRQAEVRIAELEAELLGAMREKEDVRRTATEAALRWAANDIQSHDHPVLIWDAWIRSGRKALLGEVEK